MIPLMRPPITKHDIHAVTKQMETGMLSNGAKVKEFEERFADYVGAKYCVATDSMTSGWMAVLQLLKPTKLNMPTATYVSMSNMAKQFDVDIIFRDGWVAGGAYDIITDKGVVVDSAHALEKDICTKNDTAIWLFSFHATKLLTTGKGGMIATNSKEQADFLRMIVNNGRVYANNTFEYTVHVPGWNTYMSDHVAALGISQLKRFDETNEKRDKVIELYNKHLRPDPRDRASRYIYQVWIDDFRGFYKECKKKGIQVSKHFNPIHKQPAFFTNKKFHIAETGAEHLISIPFYPDMKEEDIKEVSELVNSWRTKNG